MTDPKLKQKMQDARARIDARDYVAARRILATVDHPTARAWEARLDAIAPAANTRKRARGLWWKVPAVLVIGGLGCCSVSLFAFNEAAKSSNQSADATTRAGEYSATAIGICYGNHQINSSAWSECMTRAAP